MQLPNNYKEYVKVKLSSPYYSSDKEILFPKLNSNDIDIWLRNNIDWVLKNNLLSTERGLVYIEGKYVTDLRLGIHAQITLDNLSTECQGDIEAIKWFIIRNLRC